jgi:hypothetical protein
MAEMVAVRPAPVKPAPTPTPVSEAEAEMEDVALSAAADGGESDGRDEPVAADDAVSVTAHEDDDDDDPASDGTVDTIVRVPAVVADPDAEADDEEDDLRAYEARYGAPRAQADVQTAEAAPAVPRAPVKRQLRLTTRFSYGADSPAFGEWVERHVPDALAKHTSVRVVPMADVSKRSLVAVPTGFAVSFVDAPHNPVPVSTRLINPDRMFFGRLVVEIPMPAACDGRTRDFYRAANDPRAVLAAAQRVAAEGQLHMPWESLGLYSVTHPDNDYRAQMYVVVTAGDGGVSRGFFRRCQEAAAGGVAWRTLLFGTDEARLRLRAEEEAVQARRQGLAAAFCAALGLSAIGDLFQFDSMLHSVHPHAHDRIVIYSGCQRLHRVPAALFGFCPLRGYLLLRRTDRQPWSGEPSIYYAFPNALPYHGRLPDVRVPEDRAHDPHPFITDVRGQPLFAAKFQRPMEPHSPVVRMVLDHFGFSAYEPDRYMQPRVLVLADASAPENVFLTLAQ